MNSRSRTVVPLPDIIHSIVVLRGHKVLLDAELAALYDVTTKALNQAVNRNAERFPEDFMFRLSRTEVDALNRSQIVTGSQKHRDPRHAPYAFTEQGVAMLSSVLRSRRAITVNVQIMRAFVRMRELLVSNAELAGKLDELERKYRHHDDAIKAILSAIRQLMAPPTPKHRPIGFTADIAKKS